MPDSTPTMQPPPPPPPRGTAPHPLRYRAFSHTSLRALRLGSLGLLLALGACGGQEAAPSGDDRPGPAAQAQPTGTEAADLGALIEAYTPLPAAGTSNLLDDWYAEQRSLTARLRSSGGPVLGQMALDAFEDDPGREDSVRVALLDIAAHNLPGGAAERIEELIGTYDSELGLRVRTEAVAILAQTSPERAMAFLAPLLREDRPSSTRPPQSALVEGWIDAARLRAAATGTEVDTRVLADVATNIFQAPDARYMAIEGLGDLGGPLAGAALEEILMESSSDGYVRRKAAQALVRAVPGETLCPLLLQLAGHESDPHFLNFLADMLDRNCAGYDPLSDALPGHEGHDH